MADPLWGMLAKSAVDDETVEEAAARLIAAHEADETAHLGAGESLEAHKNSDVIDHVEGSVVADKLSFTENIATTCFENFDNWSTSGQVARATFPGAYVQAVWNTDSHSYLYQTCDYISNIAGFGGDIFIQYSFKIYGADSNSTWSIGFGASYADGLNGFGVRWDGTNFKAFVATEDETEYSVALTHPLNINSTLRFHYIKSTETFSVFISGVLVATFDMTDKEFYDDPSFYFDVTKTVSGWARLSIWSLSLSTPVS